ncbi:hypothetical protein G3I19_04965 [Streptomyces sp. SID10853]|uniref:hypothetical protein n=1 Tax=Streptomyces sp. SID10853 TaxID=2706028 RepID=UPI0013C14679|nr:hypothetical protein [Streptomyces sp. SID10853]NDZ77885.1 hypothetical protein [Streptomyces sp. SID10853]
MRGTHPGSLIFTSCVDDLSRIRDIPSAPGPIRIPGTFEAGNGPVKVLVDGKLTKTLRVHGAPTLYRLVDGKTARRATVEIRPAGGIQAYSFTFG